MLRSKLALLVLLRRRKRLKKGRRYWVHPLWRNRPELGAYSALLPQLKANPDKFIDYMRMNPEVFATLLQALNERLTKYSIRTPICAEERLMLTIRHLATGESYRSLSFQFRMGCMTVCRIISDTCSAIYEVLRQDYLAMPKTAEEWHQVALRFWEKSNIPNTLGAIDGKHVLIRKPAGSGTNFFNYKSRTSTVLMAICDADYNCIYASFGHYGHMSDGGIYDKSDFKRRLRAGDFKIPVDCEFPGTVTQAPFFFIGDGAFPLSRRLMKPFSGNDLSYEQMIFNYRLSRARRMIENFFGILAAKWRTLLKPMEQEVTNSDLMVKAILVLHNFLIRHSTTNRPGDLADVGDEDNGAWRRNVEPMESITLPAGTRPVVTEDGREVRRLLMDFFISNAGRVNFQDRMIGLI